MKLLICGNGAMGHVLYQYASEEGTFDEIIMIHPAEEETWPEERPDLLIDFSHPKALQIIYDHCRNWGGNLPVVLASTGYGPEEELIVKLLSKICPVHRSSNYSRGISIMKQICALAAQLVSEMEPGSCQIKMREIHHSRKTDAPSGTAKMLCGVLGLNPEDESSVQSLRMGTVCGEHAVYFAMEDEILEIRHSAFSKKIFAAGALEAGKNLMKH